MKSTCRLDVYGAVRQSSGASESNHKFVGALGHTSESSTDLIYMKARYYDPMVGRFISQDLARQGSNWYLYCANNPINAVDITGQWCWQIDVALLIFSFIVTPPIAALACAVIGTVAAVGFTPLSLAGLAFGKESPSGPMVFSMLLAQAGFKSFTVEMLSVSSFVIKASGAGAVVLNTLGIIAAGLAAYDIIQEAKEE